MIYPKGRITDDDRFIDAVGTPHDVVFLDFETYYDSKFSLTHLTYPEYYFDERFAFHGVGIAINDGPFNWYGRDTMDEALSNVDWDNIVLVVQNAKFDASLLKWHYGYVAKYVHDTRSLSRALYPGQQANLDRMLKREFPNNPDMWKGKELADFKGVRDLNPAQEKVMATYCEGDVNGMRALWRRWVPQMPYMELRLQQETLHMYLFPSFELNETLVQSALDQEKQEEADLVKASGVAKTKLSSNQQFGKLLESLGLKVPRKISPRTNEVTQALAQSDDALIRLMANNPQHKAIWDARKAVKSTGMKSRAKRLIQLARYFNGQLPVPLEFGGAHCVPGDTEVLTTHGWKRIDQWEGGDIAQVHPDQSIEFLPATRYVGPQNDVWVNVKAPYVDLPMTLGHRVPYLQHGNLKWSELEAADLINRSSTIIPVGGTLAQRGGYYTPERLRVIAMAQADGHFTNVGSFQIFVKRKRKQQRVPELLKAAGIRYTVGEYASHPGFMRFTVAKGDLPDWLHAGSKTFGPWLLTASTEALIAFIEELQHWDGTVNQRTGQVTYSTTIKENAEWVATLCHLTGKTGAVTTNIDKRDNRTPLYRVAIRNRNYTHVYKKHVTPELNSGISYCTETETGYWLARRNGRILVTGNTLRWSGSQKVNMQNLKRGSPLRLALRAPKGFLVYVIDLSNIEARMVAWLANEIKALQMFRQGIDTYNDMASKIYGYEVDRKLELPDGTKPFYEEGNVGKTARLGLGFGMGALRFQGTLASGPMGAPPIYKPFEFCQTGVNVFRQDNPNIVQYWYQLQQAVFDMMLQNTHYYIGPVLVKHERLELPTGLSLYYPNIRHKEITVKKLVGDEVTTHTEKNIYCDRNDGDSTLKLYGGIMSENVTQRASRDVMAECTLNAMDEFDDIVWASMSHDEGIFIMPDDHADERMAKLHQHYTTPPSWCADLPMDAEGGYAENYSK